MDLRLSPLEIQAIITCFQSHFGPQDHLWVFGSRTDPHKKGGDIDLYIETKTVDPDRVVIQHLDFLKDLFDQIEEQKVDVVINRLGVSPPLLIYEVAQKEGIKLV
jgi:predicted nucleotidyltransferase